MPKFGVDDHPRPILLKVVFQRMYDENFSCASEMVASDKVN